MKSAYGSIDIRNTRFWSLSQMMITISLLMLVTASCGSKKNSSEIPEEGAISSASSAGLKPITAKPGETVSLSGVGFTSSQTNVVKITTAGGTVVTAPVTVISDTAATFVMPVGAGLGLTSVVLESNGIQMAGAMSFVANLASNTLPIIIDSTSEICSTKQYIDKTGATKTGTKDCAAGSVADCTADGTLGCKTVAAFPPVAASLATAANIKAGVTLAGVLGTFAVADCTADGVVGCKTVAAYPSVSSTLATAANIKAGVTLAGVSGTFAGSFNNCSSAGEQSCIASGLYYAGTACAADASNCFLPDYALATQPLKAISFNAIIPAQMLDSLTLSGVTGTVVSKGSWALTAAFPGAGYYTGISAAPAAGTIATSTTILGVAGSASLAPADCNTAGQQNCVAKTTYFAGTACGANGSACYLPTYALSTQDKKAIDFSTIDAAKMLTTSTVSGVVGTIANQGSWALTAAFPGAGYYSGVSAAPSAGTIATSTTILGVAGSATLAPADCNTAGQQNCVAKTTYFAGTACAANGSACYLPTYVQSLQNKKAVDFSTIDATKMQTTLSVAGVTGTINLTNLTEGNIKNGTTIAGVAGLYPNATYKLPSAGAAAGLTNATFDAKVKSAIQFEYWTEAGAREQSAGDVDITAANIANGVSVFGLTGTLTGGSTPPNAWDVRVGTVINGVTGKLKVNCRNRVRSALYNYDGAVGSIPNTGVATGSTNYDYWDTIEDYNDGATGLPTSVVTGWTNNDCGGKETVLDDANVWKDITTTNGTTASNCATTTANCTMKDKITGLHWSKLQTSSSWSGAIKACDALSFNGQTDWRLPTQKELMEAYTHGVRSAATTNWMTEANMSANYFWSGSSVSDNTSSAWYVHLAGDRSDSDGKGTTYQVVCVR